MCRFSFCWDLLFLFLLFIVVAVSQSLVVWLSLCSPWLTPALLIALRLLLIVNILNSLSISVQIDTRNYSRLPGIFIITCLRYIIVHVTFRDVTLRFFHYPCHDITQSMSWLIVGLSVTYFTLFCVTVRCDIMIVSLCIVLPHTHLHVALMHSIETSLSLCFIGTCIIADATRVDCGVNRPLYNWSYCTTSWFLPLILCSSWIELITTISFSPDPTQVLFPIPGSITCIHLQ